MHIVLGMLGSIIMILWLLHRLAEMGIDLGGLNPWLGQRRRRWRKQYEANPIYSVESPMEMTVMLLVATAKADGDMSSEEKRTLLHVFENDFHLSKREAAGLFISSAHLLGNGEEIRTSLAQVMGRSLKQFSPTQAESAITLMEQIAQVGGTPSEMKNSLIENARTIFAKALQPKNQWN